MRSAIATAPCVTGTCFRTIKIAISYCGICVDERSSADKAMRMPLSK
jgi:hypothetical protein